MKIIEKVLFHLYRYSLRRLLPAVKPVLYHGIPTGMDHKALDRVFPTYKQLYEDIPLYESTLISAITSMVHPRDRVTTVGAGHGTTLVFAANSAGPDGQIVCYEASASAIKNSIRTIDRNNLSGRVDFIHAVVGKALSIYGKGLSHNVIDAADLEPCDVLELDCEGAELHILQELSIRPRIILVETHGVYGATTSDVAAQLQQMGYIVTDLGPAEPRILEKCAKWDLKILKADRADSTTA
ncbi:FkbM family methyltransferase [Loktanella salsilacus]|uniref:FkbM family methyltransferase n=1 Tax=Loktanella salsilacus TaxID=195913 RepID=UPI0030F771C0